MSYVIEGRVWVFGNDISTDLMAPSAYQWGTLEEMRAHVLETANPRFPKEVRDGDIIIAGRNFGCGSSREKAPKNLRNAGIRCVVGESFGRIFFRNCIAIGLPILNCRDVTAHFSDGDTARVDVETGVVENLDRKISVPGEALSGQLIETLRAGGLEPLLKS